MLCSHILLPVAYCNYSDEYSAVAGFITRLHEWINTYKKIVFFVEVGRTVSLAAVV